MWNFPNPTPTLSRAGADIIAALSSLVPDGVVGDSAGLAAFESDALAAYRQRPLGACCPKPTKRFPRCSNSPPQANADRAARRGHVAVGRRLAARRRNSLGLGADEPDSGNRI